MKSPRQPVLKWRITLMMLVAFISLEGVAIIATAQVQPPRRARRVMISPDGPQKADEPPVDIRKILVEIAQRASDQSLNYMVDLAFVVDGSVPMESLARTVEGSLTDIAGTFEESIIDYQFGLVWFQEVHNRSRIKIEPLQRGLSGIEADFVNIVPREKFMGNTAGYGLDAIMKGLNELQFRTEAEKHLVVVTSSALKTSWGADQERDEAVHTIIERCKLFEVHVNVLGINEAIQKQLADATGGRWYKIAKAPQTVAPTPRTDKSMANSLVRDIDVMFRGIAEHITTTVNQPADLVFVFDSSLSMEDKEDKVCTGLDTLVEILDSKGLDYRLGIIRFWAQAGGGPSSVTTTKPPLNVKQVKQLFRRPKRGDENLLDAIMEGVPRLQTPDNRQLILLVLTDEPSTSGPGTGYTYRTATGVCDNANAQVNVIGGVVSLKNMEWEAFAEGHRRAFAEEFQRNITDYTGGLYYIMPGAEVLTDKKSDKKGGKEAHLYR